MKKQLIDVRFTKMKNLRDRALIESQKINAKANDLLVVRTYLIDDFPCYSVEKIQGDPLKYLFNLGYKKIKELKKR